MKIFAYSVLAASIMTVMNASETYQPEKPVEQLVYTYTPSAEQQERIERTQEYFAKRIAMVEAFLAMHQEEKK